jgi:hypothetical protein
MPSILALGVLDSALLATSWALIFVTRRQNMDKTTKQNLRMDNYSLRIIEMQTAGYSKYQRNHETPE